MATNQGIADAGIGSLDGGEVDEERPMRADARRNRRRIVIAAREVFAGQGSAASMEAIARHAGVGVGTLYRHFPNRMDVVEAVYENDVEELAEAAQRAVADLEPWPAVEAFFDAFMQYARTKQVLFSELQLAFEKNPEWRSQARDQINWSFNLVIERAKRAGVVRSDVDGADVMQLVSPICTNGSILPDQSRRLMGMILDGLRAGAAEAKPA
jgi:AcrR family transcriptional regulator